MDQLPLGKVDDPSQIELLLSGCWNDLSGDEGGMTAGKLSGRIENVRWAPPLLTFEIERHGGTVLGSVYAEVQRWTVNIIEGSATLSMDTGKHLVGKRQPPLDVAPIAKEIVDLILAGKSDPRLKWSGESQVKVLIGEILPRNSAVQQTLAARRKRLRTAIHDALAAHGWPEFTRHTYRKESR